MDKKEVKDKPKQGSGRKNPFKPIIKVLAWTVGIFISLVVLIFCGIAWILTPERLTPIVENAVNGNLSADFSLGRAELTVWKTFPRLRVDIDSLEINNSRAFESLPAEESAKLPKGSGTLLRIGHFSGSVDLAALMIGKIRLYDVLLESAEVNAVAYNNEICNYDIFPESEKTEPEQSTVDLPDVAIDRFRIGNRLPIRYVSVADSIDVSICLLESDVVTENNPGYKIAVSGSAGAFLPPEISLDSISVGLDGCLDWHHEQPMEIGLRDFSVKAGPVRSKFSASLDFNDPAAVNAFDMEIEPFSPADVIAMMPKAWTESIGDIDTDMQASATIGLSKPYFLGDTLLPDIKAEVRAPRCYVVYDDYRINELEFNADAEILGSDLNKSKVTVKKMHAAVDGADVDFDGFVTSIIENPYFNGNIKAAVNLGRLPQSMAPGSLKGRIELDAATRLHQKDLTAQNFHKIFLDGILELKDVDVAVDDLNMKLYTKHTEVTLGTNNKFVSDAGRADSLLTASIKADTLSYGASGITVSVKNLRAGAGCSNNGAPKDTTAIIPIGATIYAGELAYNGDDTTAVRLRDTYAFATLSRFNQDKHSPLFRFKAGMKAAFYADKLNRLLLRNGSFEIKAHLRPLGKIETRMKHRYDSIANANPGLSQDSLIALYKKSFSRRSRNKDAEIMNFGLDNSTKRMLMRWDVSGSVNAEHGGLFTPYFPLRNRISNVNVTFSTDSVFFKDVLYKVGHSDFRINGSIKNIKNALAFNLPMRAELHLTSDTIDVNELVDASYRGAAFAEQISDGSVKIAKIENTEQLDELADRAASTGQTAALLIPVNFRAEMTMDARNIVYSNMLMHDFNGEVLAANGAVNLRNLSASSKIGNAKMTALYSAPDKRNIRFGFGLLMQNIDVREFIGMMPAVDSLMPLLSSFQGKINADIAAAADVDSLMNIVIPSMDAAMKLSGDSLVLLDAETFRTVSKWLLFKDKKKNVIPHMAVEMLIRDSKVELFPFVFDFDRYRLAVMGSNDLALNFKYHVSVLKSPVPFKFGINLSGNPDKMKVRLGGAKYKPGKSMESIAIVDTAKINLLREIDNVFRRGARNARIGALKVNARPQTVDFEAPDDTISRADSLLFIKEGLIEAPDTLNQVTQGK